MILSEDHARVAAAVAQAEAATAGEIVTAVAARSDAYRDAALHWAVLAMLAVPAIFALRPEWGERLWHLFGEDWATPPPSALYLLAMLGGALAFLLIRLLLASERVRMAIVPGATKARRVRRQAVALFRVGAERRTRGRTGVLIYLSLAERRAEIVADAAIHDKVAADVWGEAMALLIAAVRDGRAGDGLVDAVGAVGRVLAAHFPREENDVNELPDSLVEL